MIVETFPLRLADDSWHRLAVVVSGNQIEVNNIVIIVIIILIIIVIIIITSTIIVIVIVQYLCVFHVFQKLTIYFLSPSIRVFQN